MFYFGFHSISETTKIPTIMWNLFWESMIRKNSGLFCQGTVITIEILEKLKIKETVSRCYCRYPNGNRSFLSKTLLLSINDKSIDRYFKESYSKRTLWYLTNLMKENYLTFSHIIIKQLRNVSHRMKEKISVTSSDQNHLIPPTIFNERYHIE